MGEGDIIIFYVPFFSSFNFFREVDKFYIESVDRLGPCVGLKKYIFYNRETSTALKYENL